MLVGVSHCSQIVTHHLALRNREQQQVILFQEKQAKHCISDTQSSPVTSLKSQNRTNIAGRPSIGF